MSSDAASSSTSDPISVTLRGDSSRARSPISFICVFNREPILNSWLLASLDKQDRASQLVLVDNRSHAFPSAAAALNAGAARADGSILAFVHQDIRLIDADFVARLAQYFETLPDIGVAGTAGVNGATLVSSVTHGDTPLDKLEPAVAAPTPVQAGDEHLMAIRRELFDQTRFDEKVCPAWDLYGVDLCLAAAALGKTNYVLPLQLMHLSYGKLTWNYARSLERVRRKWRGRRTDVPTCCGYWSTRRDGRAQYIAHKIRSAGRRLRRLIGTS